jgi:hypothetical protein
MLELRNVLNIKEFSPKLRWRKCEKVKDVLFLERFVGGGAQMEGAPIPLGMAQRITIDLSCLLKLFLRRPASGPLSVETERENDFRYTKDFTHE